MESKNLFSSFFKDLPLKIHYYLLPFTECQLKAFIIFFEQNRFSPFFYISNRFNLKTLIIILLYQLNFCHFYIYLHHNFMIPIFIHLIVLNMEIC